MFYDLHIHSCLSPCATDEMTVNNIVNMSLIKGLDLIAICDHNSVRQLPAFSKAASGKIRVLYGVEIQTKEDVHVLGYFLKLEDALSLQPWLDEHLIVVKNDPRVFGNQLILNERDEVVAEERNLLLSSVDVDLQTVCECIHEHHGWVVLAHVLHRINSITTQLGFIPYDLKYDGIEISKQEDKEQILASQPWVKEDTLWLMNSDAHQLIDIHEAEYELSKKGNEMLCCKI